MTVEEAKDRIRLWSLISRAQRVGMPVPEKWRKYGFPPTNPLEYMNVAARAIFCPVGDLFTRDSPLYTYLKGRR